MFIFLKKKTDNKSKSPCLQSSKADIHQQEQQKQGTKRVKYMKEILLTMTEGSLGSEAEGC